MHDMYAVVLSWSDGSSVKMSCRSSSEHWCMWLCNMSLCSYSESGMNVGMQLQLLEINAQLNECSLRPLSDNIVWVKVLFSFH